MATSTVQPTAVGNQWTSGSLHVHPSTFRMDGLYHGPQPVATSSVPNRSSILRVVAIPPWLCYNGPNVFRWRGGVGFFQVASTSTPAPFRMVPLYQNQRKWQPAGRHPQWFITKILWSTSKHPRPRGPRFQGPRRLQPARPQWCRGEPGAVGE